MPLIVPIRDFRGMTRLRAAIDEDHRTGLARLLATQVVNAGNHIGLRVIVVTSDAAVSSWATALNLDVTPDPGLGLSAAASHAVRQHRGPWLLAHADLPLVDAESLGLVADIAERNTVLVPSLDGGTNVIAHRGPFPFSFGEGSFHRHLAAAPDATIVSRATLSVELDTPVHLNALIASGSVPSLIGQ